MNAATVPVGGVVTVFELLQLETTHAPKPTARAIARIRLNINLSCR